MADYIDITAPVIEDLTIEPSVVPACGMVEVSAKVTEQIIKRLLPVWFYSGEIEAGET